MEIFCDEFRLGQKNTKVIYTDEFPNFGESREMLYVFDRSTAAIYPRLPEGSLVLEPGEATKSWAGVESIIAAALKRGMARDSYFIAVGGGMICDLTAFAASVYMRGASVWLVPTSLLAMVDASFGGKTAINFGGYKNIVGTFYPAGNIVICSAFLRSLPRREYLSGLAELIKYAMLGDAVLYRKLQKKGAALLEKQDAAAELDMIRRSLKAKARFAAKDPSETGVRAYLNLGHTFGHGLESAAGLGRYTHGEAVAWGILRALDAGKELCVTDPFYADGAARLFAALGFPLRAQDVSAEAIIDAMGSDKKKKEGKLRFVLQRGLCDTFTENLDMALVRKVVERGLK